MFTGPPLPPFHFRHRRPAGVYGRTYGGYSGSSLPKKTTDEDPGKSDEAYSKVLIGTSILIAAVILAVALAITSVRERVRDVRSPAPKSQINHVEKKVTKE